MKKILLIGLAVLAWSSDALATEIDIHEIPMKVVVSDDIPPSAQKIFHRAFMEFVDNACPLLRVWAPNFAAFMTWKDQPQAPYRADKFGWGTELDIMLVDSELAFIHYYLGRGLSPGVIVQKQVAADLCGMTKENGLREVNPGAGGDLFFPYP